MRNADDEGSGGSIFFSEVLLNAYAESMNKKNFRPL